MPHHLSLSKSVEPALTVSSSSSAFPTPPALPQRGSRGPPPRSCAGCRVRRVKCLRMGENEPCAACLKKGITCTMVENEKSPLGRSGRRIETAKALYGSLPAAAVTSISVASTSVVPASSIAPSGLETSLADNEMSETLGLELITAYAETGSSKPDPLFPPPCFKVSELKTRLLAVGRRLSMLSADDQLLIRVIFATAARLRPSAQSTASDLVFVRQLVTNAQSHVDAAGAWRKASRTNAICLLLLHRVVGEGEIGAQNAMPYLIALSDHLKTMSTADPTVVLGEFSPKALVWFSFFADTTCAIERRDLPTVSDFAFGCFLKRVSYQLPPIEAIKFALRNDRWTVVKYLRLPLAAFLMVGRDLAKFCRRVDGFLPTREDAEELADLWARMETICSWSREALLLVEEDDSETDAFAAAVLQFHAGAIYGASGVAQQSIVEYLDELPQHLFLPEGPFSPLQNFRARFIRNGCSSLRRLRRNFNNLFSVFTGSLWSTSRLISFGRYILETDYSDQILHPGGAADKLESLLSLSEAFVNVGRAYPSEEICRVCADLDAEAACLRALLGTTVVSSSRPFANSNRPSIGALMEWTATLDEAESPVVLYEDDRGGVYPQPAGPWIRLPSANPRPVSMGTGPSYSHATLGRSDQASFSNSNNYTSLVPPPSSSSYYFPPPSRFQGTPQVPQHPPPTFVSLANVRPPSLPIHHPASDPPYGPSSSSQHHSTYPPPPAYHAPISVDLPTFDFSAVVALPDPSTSTKKTVGASSGVTFEEVEPTDAEQRRWEEANDEVYGLWTGAAGATSWKEATRTGVEGMLSFSSR